MVSITGGQQEKYDEATFAFSQGDYEGAIAKLNEVLAEDSTNFEARLALGMAFYRKGDYPAAIAEGHKAEALRPNEQLVHTNLSLFYMKSGNKTVAEHHGVQARIASWKTGAPTAAATPGDPELQLAKPSPPPPSPPEKFPDMPWKSKPKVTGGGAAPKP